MTHTMINSHYNSNIDTHTQIGVCGVRFFDSSPTQHLLYMLKIFPDRNLTAAETQVVSCRNAYSAILSPYDLHG